MFYLRLVFLASRLSAKLQRANETRILQNESLLFVLVTPMRLSEDNETASPRVNILPMIDVIFAILAFLIMSTLYLTKPEGLPVNLPQAVTSTPQNPIDVTLTITSGGELFLGSDAVALADLADRVRQIAADRSILVTIRADETVNLGRVVAAMDQLRQVNGVKLGIATTQP